MTLPFTKRQVILSVAAAAGIGFVRRPLGWWERAVLGGAAVGLLLPGLLSDGFGIMALAVIVSRK